MIEDDSIIHPRKGKKEKSVPARGIFCANSLDAQFFHETLRNCGGEGRYLHHSSLTVDKDNKFFIAGPSVGAPLATLSFEKLIALGASEIVFVGWCGAIDQSVKIGDTLIGDMAVSGEGTSRYYSCENNSFPSKVLTTQLIDFLHGKIEYRSGAIWSTDAPYRESKAMLSQLHHDHGVAGVDMEYSALCAVAAFRKVHLAALFVVSDELFGSSWNPGFAKDRFRQTRIRLLNLLLEIYTP